MQYTFELFKPALVRLVCNHILRLLGMTAWGVGAMPLNVHAMPFNVHAMLEHNKYLAFVIRTTQHEYAKAFKGIWMECD